MEKATLDDYLNSFELDGTMTDHAQREASQALGCLYGKARGRQLQIGRELWRKRVAYLQWQESGK